MYSFMEEGVLIVVVGDLRLFEFDVAQSVFDFLLLHCLLIFIVMHSLKQYKHPTSHNKYIL